MLEVTSTGVAFFLMLLAMSLLATWPNTFKAMQKQMRVEYMYLDFTVSFLLSGGVFGLTLGSVGSASPNVKDNHTGALRIVCACASGAVICSSNLFRVWAQERIGVTNTFFINGGLSLVLGSGINYAIDSSKNNAAWLFCGVASSFLAVCLSTLSNRHLAEDKKRLEEKQAAAAEKQKVELTQISILVESTPESAGSASISVSTPSTPAPDMLKVDGSPVRVHLEPEGVTQLQNNLDKSQVEQQHPTSIQSGVDSPLSSISSSVHQPDSKSISTSSSTASTFFLGVLFAVIAGLFGGVFGALFNLATNAKRIDSTPLTTFTAFLFFCVAFCITSFMINVIKLRTAGVESPFREWRSFTISQHALLWSSGLICCAANICIFLGGKAAGYSASVAISSSNPLVGVLWGVFYWREFDQSSRVTRVLLVGMVIMYLLAIVLIFESVY